MINRINASARSKQKSSWIRNRSIVFWIILINCIIYFGLLIYLASVSTPQTDPESLEVIKYFALKPSNILHGQYLSALLLHMFTHFSAAHIFVNMFALFSLGALCEKIIGRKRFIWFYLGSGLFAGVLSVVLAGFFGGSKLGGIVFGTSDIFMVGASGAIFGIAGLYTILLPKLKFSIIFLPFWPIKGYILIPAVLFGFWIVTIISGLLGYIIPLGNVAHFGGFLVGVFYGVYLKTKYKKKVDRLQRFFR